MSEDWHNTLPGRLYQRAEKEPDHIAMREKRRGIWSGISWAEYLCCVASLARELEKQKIEQQTYAAIYAEDTAEWIFAQLALQLLGVISIGIHPSTYEEELLAICQASRPKIVFCGGQEQVDRIFAIGKDYSDLQWAIVINPRGTYHYQEEKLLRYHQLVQDFSLEEAKEWYKVRLKKIDPDMLAIALSSNGTADFPHYLLFKQATVLNVAVDFARSYAISTKDTNLCHLPLCHYIEQLFSVALPLVCGICPHIAESEDTIMEDLQALSPTVLISWASFWNRLRFMVLQRLTLSGLIRNFFFDLFLNRRIKKVQLRAGQRPTIWDRWLSRLANLFFFRALRNRLGLKSCRLAISTCGEIGEYTIQWYLGIGVPLIETYGLSETLGAGFGNSLGTEEVGTCGMALPRLKYRFDKNGELMVQGAYVCSASLFTAKDTIERDGWIRSGDFGLLDSKKRLHLSGNKNFFVKNQDQESFSIKRTEELLRANEYIREIVCVADQRPFVTALIEPNFDRLADQILVEGGRFKYYEDLVQSPAAHDFITSEIKTLNEQLISIEKVQDFRFFPQELDEIRGELSFDYAPRRHVIERLYKSLLDEMYNRQESRKNNVRDNITPEIT